MADAVQFAKVKAIVDADPMRVAVVVSAACPRERAGSGMSSNNSATASSNNP